MFIRAVLKGQKKKIKGSDKPSFDFLMKELVRCFGESVKKAEIGYYDEDKEFIRLTNDEEWEICIEETHIKNKGKDVYTVEVHVIPADNATEVSVSEISDATKSFIAAPMIDTTKSDIQDWKVIDKTDEEQKVFSEPILHESMSMPTEPSIFEDPVIEEKPAETSQIQSFSNYSQNDILVDIKVTGTPEELERIQRTVIHQFAPHAGFEVDKCEVLVKRECPEEMSDNDSILDNGSQISHMTNELKDEIETLIEEKLKRLSLYREEPKMTKKSAPERISCGNYDHGCVTCDNCRQRITGCARFKSIFRRDFDLCETCEATGIHPEPLIKIRNPIGPKIGWRLNAEFETIKSLFTLEEPKKVQVFQSLPLCHIRKTNEEKMEKIAKAEQCLKSSIFSSKIETPTKMDVEKTVKAPSLCHIRATPKIEEKPAMKEEPICAPVKVEPTETPKKVDSGMLSILSRMFPHHDTKVIAEFLSKNEGLTLEDIVNKFMDTKL